MGAFNEWTKDSWLEKVENRRVAEVGLNLLHGAAVQLRAWRCATRASRCR